MRPEIRETADILATIHNRTLSNLIETLIQEAATLMKKDLA